MVSKDVTRLDINAKPPSFNADNETAICYVTSPESTGSSSSKPEEELRSATLERVRFAPPLSTSWWTCLYRCCLTFPPTPGSNETPQEMAETIMDIVFVASEVAPWSKTGGLADVLGSLPVALAARGHRVMVVAPR